jgi:hypothetical protein
VDVRTRGETVYSAVVVVMVVVMVDIVGCVMGTSSLGACAQKCSHWMLLSSMHQRECGHVGVQAV